MEPLERLLAERACERPIVTFACLVDLGEETGVAALFTDDGVYIGEYHDRFAHTPAGWRFAQRRAEPTFARLIR